MLKTAATGSEVEGLPARRTTRTWSEAADAGVSRQQGIDCLKKVYGRPSRFAPHLFGRSETGSRFASGKLKSSKNLQPRQFAPQALRGVD